MKSRLERRGAVIAFAMGIVLLVAIGAALLRQG